MSINARPSIRGFIASEPEKLETVNGNPYVKVRFGQERRQREEDGTFTDLGKTYATLIAYNDNIERIANNYVPGDRFIAQGKVKTFSNEEIGQDGEVFVASGIGHDTAYTHYDVDRSPRRRGPEHEAAAAAAGQTTERPATEASHPPVFRAGPPVFRPPDPETGRPSPAIGI
ncbi:MAG: single-stranded DNA-binding protein [Brevibacterium linens]